MLTDEQVRGLVVYLHERRCRNEDTLKIMWSKDWNMGSIDALEDALAYLDNHGVDVNAILDEYDERQGQSASGEE